MSKLLIYRFIQMYFPQKKKSKIKLMNLILTFFNFQKNYMKK